MGDGHRLTIIAPIREAHWEKDQQKWARKANVGSDVRGMVGIYNLGLADALRLQTQNGNIGYIGICHEGVAAFAASAYGKLTGKPAACLTIAGPGAINLLTGLWDAMVDRAPILALTGQVQTQVFGPCSRKFRTTERGLRPVCVLNSLRLRNWIWKNNHDHKV